MPSWDVSFEPGRAMDTRSVLPLVVEAEACRRSVLKIPLPPDKRREFDRLNIVRQIAGTTGIEGNGLGEEGVRVLLRDLTVDPAARARSGEQGAARPSLEEREVLNSSKALQYVQSTLVGRPGQPVSEELIRRLHRVLTEGCDYGDNAPGQYRLHNVVVGDYRPPDYQAVPGLVERFVEFINSREVRQGHGPLLAALLAHFYLISIHPFGDGNGRTSRAVEAFLLYQGGYNVRGFYSLSNYFYRHRGQYFRALMAARFEHGGNPLSFLDFALRGFLEELATIQNSILGYVGKVIFRDIYLRAEKQGRLNSRCYALMEYLTFDCPQGIEVEAFRSRAHHIVRGLYSDLKSQRTLVRDLALLKAQGLVVEREGALVANLKLLSEDVPPPAN